MAHLIISWFCWYVALSWSKNCTAQPVSPQPHGALIAPQVHPVGLLAATRTRKSAVPTSKSVSSSTNPVAQLPSAASRVLSVCLLSKQAVDACVQAMQVQLDAMRLQNQPQILKEGPATAGSERCSCSSWRVCCKGRCA